MQTAIETLGRVKTGEGGGEASGNVMGINCLPLVKLGLTGLPKYGRPWSPRPLSSDSPYFFHHRFPPLEFPEGLL